MFNNNSLDFFCRQDYSESCIPTSNCFKLLANTEQVLNSIAARRLITYEKIAEPNVIQIENIANIKDDFRPKFFAENDAERKERKMHRMELKEIGRQEALKRGKDIIVKRNDGQT